MRGFFWVTPCYDNKTVIDFLGKSYLIQKP